MITVTDFVVGAGPLGPAPSLPPVRRLLSRLVNRATAPVTLAPAAETPVELVADVTTVVATPVAAPAVRAAEDLTCSWPSFVKGTGLESMRWMDTPDGPVLVGRFTPPVPRHL